jgi:hypothetical protein
MRTRLLDHFEVGMLRHTPGMMGELAPHSATPSDLTSCLAATIHPSNRFMRFLPFIFPQIEQS